MVLHLLGQINEKTRENFDLQCQLDWLKRQFIILPRIWTRG
jgi:hypothetical protein